MAEWEWAHAAVGVVATLIFLFQTFGAGHDGEYPEDEGGDVGGFSDYMTVRNFVALFMGYGWVTLAALLSGVSRTTASLLGICAGIALVFISLYLIKTFLKFQEDGTLNLKKLIGKHSVVYIAVGGSASGAGKVLVDTESGRVELPARTNDPDTIRTGRDVTILSADGGVLWVTAKDK